MRAARPINRHQTPEQFIVEQLRATSTYSSDALFAWVCAHDTGSNRVFGVFTGNGRNEKKRMKQFTRSLR